ncbi:CLUMA_CG015031, isoform A [Clunio marinus]|uniref:CLUMA_CG015031, isoform A n=1 Tax=Clunio marinus TaxID=568069 RepID=A0A1J1INL1_9DIPT|nr:CLUMA_CG015031, isoform A [Clunio marinus]
MCSKTSLTFLALISIVACVNGQALGFEFDCLYEDATILDIFGYTCTLTDIDYDFSSPFYFIRVGGEHLEGRTNADVINLRIRNSTINRIPANIFNVFPNVEGLEVINCGTINFIPPDFYFADRLREVYIADNNITTLGNSAFTFAFNIEILILYQNQMNSLGPNPFINLGRATFVSIENNNITVLTPRMLRPLLSLKNFVASGNRIEELEGRMFANNPDLELAHFERNNIRAIGPSFLNINPNLESLRLSGNACIDGNFDNVTLTAIREALGECFRNSPWGTQVSLTVVGSLSIFDENDNLITRIE